MSRREKVRKQKFRVAKDVCYIFFCSIILAGIFKNVVSPVIDTFSPSDILLSPIASQMKVEAQEITPTTIPTLTATPTPELTKKVPLQDEIESYIKTIFRKDGAMAVEVSHHECSPSHRDYPRCEKNDNIEWSCGIWQINLRDPKTLKYIHATKVPGETLEEKCNWLKDPYQSTLVAYYIYTHSGFCPWTWYKKNYCK